jgi:alpha-galactosidase
MIHYNPETNIFNLIMENSYYAFQIDGDGRAVHLGWGPRPAAAPETAVLTGSNTQLNLLYWGQGELRQNPRHDELHTFGDNNQQAVSLKASFHSLPATTAPHEAPHLPIRDVRLRYHSHTITTEAQPGLSPIHGMSTRSSQPRQTLKVIMADPVHPFRVTLCYRLTPEYDMIERWCELENLGETAVTIETCSFATLHLPNGTNQLTNVAGTWSREFITQRHTIPFGRYVMETRGLNTGHASNPFFLINRPGQAWEETGTVYFGQLAYSGNWRITIEHTPTYDVRIHGGYNPFDFELTLAPGKTHKTPALVCGVSPNGWGGASRRMHAFTRHYILPAPPQKDPIRPVLYNSWEATLFNLSFESQRKLAQIAASIGVELFCVDDGWFGGRRSDAAGLGDWYVSPDVFPQGLTPLIEEVHKLGMKFGLWVEPEMVNPDSDLYRQHPDWVLHFPGRPRSEARNQLILDFGRPEVVDHIFHVLNNLLTEHDIDFIKWDMNRYATEPGSAVGKGIWQTHVKQVYHLIDRLRQKHPHVTFQSCSGGGGRVDLGMLARAEQVWPSDNTDPFDRLDIQEGFSLAYPACTMEAWVTDSPQQWTQRESRLETRFHVAMRGVLGIGVALNRLSEAELALYAKFIAFYKRIRHLVQYGDMFRLERMEEFGRSVVAFVSPDGREAVYSVVVGRHLFGAYFPARPLKRLNVDGVYRLLNHYNQEVFQATGYELMTLGVPGDAMLNVGDGRTLFIQQIDSDK